MVQLDNTRQKKFILQRKLGQKTRITNSGQWQILDDDCGDEQCWISDQHILTIFLWHKQIAEQ
jgi:hypothetical protein